ncbi:MAG: penicillin-binding protein 2 [Candidatus Sericytochromatia bacterium]|nr:penicillin-binding protein 2 [Candidatus Sericytochromatia bacterium]
MPPAPPISRTQQIDRRIHVLYLVLLLSFLGLAGRAAYLQIYQHQDFLRKAAAQQKKLVRIAAKRGMITDRNGHKLALDVQAYSVYVDPEYVKNTPAEIAARLAPVLEMSVSDLQADLEKKQFWHYLTRKVDEKVADAVRALKIPGIGILSENKRVYPHDNLGSSLIGYTDIDNEGREGIEKSFDEFLQGGTNKVGILTDAYGNELLRAEGDLPFLTEKSKANKVVLTIDENVQYIAERELQKGMESTQAERGVAIVMRVDNGDLLALATNPSVNPNEIIQQGWDARIKNWAVTDFYEPGSTMKIFTVAAALEAQKTTIDEVIPTPTLIHLDGWPVHDHHQPPGRVRMLTPLQMMEVSSNVGTSILGRRMPPEEHRNLLLKFGFGRKTHSRLNGEVAGILPPLPWPASRQSTVSFGQGVAVTPLQVVTATSAIANRGVRVEPRIIERIVSPEGDVIKAFEPVKTQTLSESTAQDMLKMMEEVVESKGGTGHGTKLPGYLIGGKTGTADKVVGGRYNGDVMSSFVGVLPTDRPQFVIFVLFDAPKTAHYASLTAVPVFKEIARNLISYYGLQPSRPEELNAYRMRR